MGKLAEISLRPESAEDAPFIDELVIAVSEMERGFRDLPVDERTRLLVEQSRLQQADYRRKFPQAHFLVIVVSGKLVGRFYVNHTTNHTRVVELSVLPDYQGHGIGHQLSRKGPERDFQCEF